MTWTRLDDLWTDNVILADLDYADRWHYLAMIQFCSRTGSYTGELRAADARRCSDHPDPTGALYRLTATGLISKSETGYKVNQIDDHIPPPSVRQESERAKIRKRRSRMHKEGDHSICLPEHCTAAPTPPDGPKGRGTGDVTRDITGDTRTGQDRPGLQDSQEEEVQNMNVGSSSASSGGEYEAASSSGEVDAIDAFFREASA